MAASSYRVLIIDDFPEDRELYRRLLDQDPTATYQFAEADAAEEALALWNDFRPDCVLLDYRLPGLDGLDLLHRFELSKVYPAAVIMLTGQGDEGVAVAAMKTGAQDYLVKSKLTADALQGALHAAIERARQQFEVAQKQAELERLATMDPLTGVYNRRYFLERLEMELARARRYHTTFTVLMLDVDFFKHVNDNHGHLMGDQVLVRVGELLGSSFRSSDLVARFGGEEFCILAASTDLDGGRIFAERIRQLIGEQVFPVPGKASFQVTCSVGLVVATGDEVSGLELIAHADEALYQAKRTGRNRVCVYSPDNAVLS
jgi:two-component system cell cycle response regulator